MKKDILVMGELNVDLILSEIEDFPKIGTEILSHKMNMVLGGSSAIFASNSAALGANVSFLGKAGLDYFGDFIMNALKSNKLDVSPIIRSKDNVTGATICLVYGEDRAMVTHPGAMALLSGQDLTTNLLKNFRHFHLSSLFLQPLVKRDVVEIFKKAKSCGLTTSLDPQWDPAEKWDVDFAEMLNYVDVFIPNDSEIKAITKKTSVEEAAAQIAPLVKTLVVKMGVQGSMAFRDGRKYSAPPFLNKETVDAIGAGDSFDAGFVTQFVSGADLETCLRHGNLMGAISTTAAGGTAAFASPELIRKTAQEKFNVTVDLKG